MPYNAIAPIFGWHSISCVPTLHVIHDPLGRVEFKKAVLSKVTKSPHKGIGGVPIGWQGAKSSDSPGIQVDPNGGETTLSQYPNRSSSLSLGPLIVLPARRWYPEAVLQVRGEVQSGLFQDLIFAVNSRQRTLPYRCNGARNDRTRPDEGQNFPPAIE